MCKLHFPLTCQDEKFSKDIFLRSYQTKVIMSHGQYKHIWLVELVISNSNRKIKKIVLWKCKESRQKFRYENFFGILKSSDIGRSFENVLGKFRKFGPWFFAVNFLVCVCVCRSVRLWDVDCGSCLRILEGHEELVRCIRFDHKRIISGAYDGWEQYFCS